MSVLLPILIISSFWYNIKITTNFLSQTFYLTSNNSHWNKKKKKYMSISEITWLKDDRLHKTLIISY